MTNLAEQVYAKRPDKTQVLVQDWLRAGGNLESVKKLWDITARRGILHTNLVSLKYGLESPMSNNLVRQCRGLVLDESAHWRVMARPFDKFFNHGEAFAAEVDWDTAHVGEKLDGSLISMYHYPSGAGGEWMFATTGTPDASGDVTSHPMGYTYSQLAHWIMQESHMEFPNPDMWSDWTFLFELLSPFNRVVVRQTDHKLVCLGARHRVTGEELRPSELPLNKLNWSGVQEFNLYSMPEVLYTFQKMDPLQQEGYVVCDHLFNRIKVKHPGYVALHHLRGNGFTPKRILERVQAGETSEILASFPEWKIPFSKVKYQYDRLVGDCIMDWITLKDFPFDNHEDRKRFAAKALKSTLPACMFAMRKGKVSSVNHFIRDMHLDTLHFILATRQPT